MSGGPGAAGSGSRRRSRRRGDRPQGSAAARPAHHPFGFQTKIQDDENENK